MLHISLAGEAITHLGFFPVTNSLITTWIVMALLILIAFAVRNSIKNVPTRFQLLFEMIISALYDLFEGVLGSKVKTFFPLLASLFLFIIISNWIGLVPGVGSIGVWEEEKTEAPLHINEEVIVEQQNVPAVDSHEAFLESQPQKDKGESAAGTASTKSEKKLIPLFRAPTADLNTTLGLALISFITLQVFGFKALGGSYAKKFINISNPINFYVGILEIISEFGKIISFGFRLFGNIFAGEVLLTVIAFLVPVLAPIPFLGLELFVGLIQAIVFSMLTAVFLSTATTKTEH